MIILAFPGMGKTRLCKERAGYIDLDYDYFRAVKGKRVPIREMNQFYTRMAWMYHKQGFTVLCNEPFIQYFEDIVDKMLLPNNLFFSAQKLGVSIERCEQYVADWERWANSKHVPIKYVDIGLEDLTEEEMTSKLVK